jgi:hypothetical protein
VILSRGVSIFFRWPAAAHATPPPRGRQTSARANSLFRWRRSTRLIADKETGLRDWSDQQIRDAMTRGIRPNGEKLLPVMPYGAYSGMSEEDLKALIAYLRSLKPVRKETAALKTWAPLYRAGGTFVWFQFFSRFSNSPAKAPQSGIERGRYLVEHVALCIDCHTPRNFMGVPNRLLYLAGPKKGPLGQRDSEHHSGQTDWDWRLEPQRYRGTLLKRHKTGSR